MMMDSMMWKVVYFRGLRGIPGRAAALYVTLSHNGWRGTEALILGVFTSLGLVPQLLTLVSCG